jgi:hypothetical protein
MARRPMSINLTASLLLCAALLLIAVVDIVHATSDQEIIQKLRQNCERDINDFILDKLEKNRIVMLGDMKHGDPIYVQTVSTFLDYWVKQIAQDSTHEKHLPHKIYLVLEINARNADLIRSFLKTGDFLSGFNYDWIVTQLNTTRMEFYFDLRLIFQNIASYNKNSRDSISLEIVGPEEEVEVSHWSRKLQDSIFIYQRDEYSSQQVINLLDRNPDSKALVYYGSGHLIKQKAIKTGYELKGEGYYMAHYFIEHYGKSAVYTIEQPLLNQISDAYKYYWPIGNSFAFDNNTVDPEAVSTPIKEIEANGSIIHFGYDAPVGRRAIDILSENMVKFMLHRLNDMAGKDSINDQSTRAARVYLTQVSGTEWDGIKLETEEEGNKLIQKWNDWYAQTKLDIVDDIVTQAPAKRLIDIMARSTGKRTDWYDRLIGDYLNEDPYLDSSRTPFQRADDYRQYLQDNMRSIVIGNLVSMLWIATDAEHDKAVALLRKMTGQNLTTAKQWTVWWRENKGK